MRTKDTRLFISMLCIVFLLSYPLWGHCAQVGGTNIIMISVDALRADYLGCYGHPGSISPTIDKFSKTGILYADTLTTIGKTGPAFAALFTSQFPPTTGARRNGMRLRPDIPVLAQLLSDAGYYTAAILSNWTLKDRLCGLKRGFAFYDEEFPKTRKGPMAKEKTARDVTQRAENLFTNVKKIPYFYWIHYSDPHSPYIMHQKFINVFPSKGAVGRKKLKKRTAYLSEIRYTDYWIGKLFTYLNRNHSLHNSAIIFTADHGESLGEHHYWGHGKNSHYPNLAVPLIIRKSESRRNLLRTNPVSSIDLMPTILPLAGVPTPANVRGMDILNEFPDENRSRYAFADRGLKLMFHGTKKYKHPKEICLIADGVKLVFSYRKNGWWWFDLIRDPAEQIPLPVKQGSLQHSLQRAFKKWYDHLPKYTKANPASLINDQDVDFLKALGYIEE